MFTLTHFGMLSLGGFLFQNVLTFNILQKTSSTAPTARKQYATAETLTPKVRNPRKSVNT